MATLVLTQQDLIDPKKEATLSNIKYDSDYIDVVVYMNGKNTTVLKSDVIGD